MTRTADLVARTLHTHGVRHAFGMPGGEVVTLIDALEAAGIRFVLCRHETAAAIMAAGAFAVTGTPGLLVTTLGPGLANAVNGIADANQERVPLIVVSGVVEHGLRGRYTHQILDQTALLQPLVKGSFEIERYGPGATAARAIRLAMRAPMGPVLIQLSPDTAAAVSADSLSAAMPARKLETRTDPASEAVTHIAAMIRHAERPLIVAGLEAVRDGAGEAILRLMETTGAPLVTTYKAKGLVDETHPLSLGGAGLSPLADKALLPIIASADLVLLAGYDPIEMRAGWIDPFSPGAEIVEFSSCPADHGMHAASFLAEASPHSLVDALNHVLASQTVPPTWPGGEPASARARLDTLFAPPPEWGPHAVFDVLQKALPENAYITADSGAHRILLSQQMKIRKPLGLIQSAGFCTMGAAVPLAAGARIARPDLPVVAVLGDGGLEMGLGELATLRDQGARVIIVVLQDESLALIELKQAQAGLARRGVELGRSRFEDIAGALGGRGWRVASRETFEAALSAALHESAFTVITCEIQVNDYAEKF